MHEEEVMIFKLVNGQELIAKVVEGHSEGWVVSHSRVFMPKQDPRSPQGWVMTLAPYIVALMNTENVAYTILRSGVAAYTADIPEDLLKEYKQAVSGLILAKGL